MRLQPRALVCPRWEVQDEYNTDAVILLSAGIIQENITCVKHDWSDEGEGDVLP